MITIGDALAQARRQLAAASDSAHYDARELLGHLLGRSTAWLYAHLDDPLDQTQTQSFFSAVEQRAAGVPVAYLTGLRGFYRWEFAVAPEVLIPRPETEQLVETAYEWLSKRHLQGAGLTLVDVGTGSGIIAIALALLLPQATVFATDLSPAALEVARLNAERLGASPVAFCQGDLLAALPADCRVDLLVANLPYIACDDLAKLEVARWEPRLALDGGPDGLDLIRRLLKQAPAYLNPGGLILLEIGADQGIATRQLGRDAFPTAVVSVRCDLAGLDRLVCIDLAGDHGDFGIGSTCTDEI